MRLPLIMMCIINLASAFLMTRTSEGADLTQTEKAIELVEDSAAFWFGEELRPSQGLNLSAPLPQWSDMQSIPVRNVQGPSRVIHIKSCYTASVGRFLSELGNSIEDVSEFDAGMVRFQALKSSQFQFAACSRYRPN